MNDHRSPVGGIHGSWDQLIEEVGSHYSSDALGKFVLSVTATQDYVVLENYILIPRERMFSPGNTTKVSLNF